ncbi:MAG: hypothetical protein LW814_12420 [Anabaena sp. CoA2_C59]|jgi:hypothetical protein|nr:hypothetical protein [Anabaena sp. CoA2_C59]MDJ0505993.1 hypothetical protein [Nostocales cyanobacterium LE14-WE12]OBQ17674.1 MAG: hypothetical protein AN488_18290 [Anabaena sp. WA113]
MNSKAIILSAILGISTPAIIDMAIPNQAMAVQKFNYPNNTFSDKEWTVILKFTNNSYHYHGMHTKGSSINLSGAVASGTHERQVYTWNNNGTKYQVTYRPNDPNYIRVQVIDNKGKIILNRLLQAIP